MAQLKDPYTRQRSIYVHSADWEWIRTAAWMRGVSVSVFLVDAAREAARDDGIPNPSIDDYAPR